MRPHPLKAWFFLLLSAGLALGDSNSPARPINRSTNQPVIARGEIAPPRLPVQSKSPVEVFRTLLAMSAVERYQFLTNRPVENQRRIVAKIREYESLPPDEREVRLRVTELRWYLLPLMSSPATNRAEALNAIPPEMHRLVEERLREWDILPPPLKRELLDNESAIRFFTETDAASATRSTNRLDTLPAAQRETLETGLAQWQRMPEDQRQRMIKQFDRFFGLTPREKEHALKTLSEAERQQIDKTLKNFASLPPAHRSQAIRSFEKFASLSPEERQLFLKNAERWEQMTPAERQSWRNLVTTLTMLPVPPTRFAPRPPLPPGFKPTLPPMPPGLATNQ